MSIVLADRVRETTTTTGTGTVNLAGASTGYQGFVAGAGDGAVVYYAIVGQAGETCEGEWETGIGTVTDASPDTLSRTTILASSNAGAAVDFSAGTKDVFLTYPARAGSFMGCLVKKSSDVAIATATTTEPTFDTETYDIGGWHDNSTNPNRLTVPANVDYVRVSAGARWQDNTTGMRGLYVRKNGGAFVGIPHVSIPALTGSANWHDISSPVVAVTPSDYFTMVVVQTSGGNLNLIGDEATFFAIEKVGP